MDVFPTTAAECTSPANAMQSHPPLAPTPDFGTLGPGSDVEQLAASTPASAKLHPAGNLRMLHFAAAILGAVVAILASRGSDLVRATNKIAAFATPKSASTNSIEIPERDLDRQKPQQQAEFLLARAVSRDEGVSDQIQARLESWRGKLKWNPQLSDLTTVALNSSDEAVRTSAIEVQLAAYGVAKKESTVDSLVQQADSSDHAKKIWALWTLGLLGNRGIQTDRVVQVLTAHLNASVDSNSRAANSNRRDSYNKGSYNNDDTRRWAVEGLALVGTSSTIAPLLNTMHNDSSPIVRERAACSLAESGMLTHQQRMTAVPRLIDYSDDSALDSQTRAWAFQALNDITQQRLPNDTNAWRSWYHEQGAGLQ